ncbi:MAG: hypothetical protein IPJ16_02245 [Bacteroidales bacterium]|nr:hypothetical protein [Bacteroidales bacterium]
MRIGKIPVAVLLLNILFLNCAFGQSQSVIPEYISQKFQSYCNSVIREEIFIHTDKEEYISGEDIWFNIYLIDRKSFKPATSGKIAYVEILNYENKPVIQKRFMLEGGVSPGHLVLPDTLSSGTYTIIAYTNWMKNFLPYNCFIKEIEVYNAFNTNVFKRSERIFEEKEAITETSANSGLNLTVNNRKQDSLEIFVNTDEEFRIDNKNQIFLFIQTHGVINYFRTEKILSENTRIAVPKMSLLPGINQITIFDSEGPVCERYIYTPGKKNQDIILHSIDSCIKRDEVTIDVEIVNNSSQKTDLKNLSVSVSPVSSSIPPMDLYDYLIFGTEFGFSPQSMLYRKRTTEISPEILDSLLLTLKSNWIIWDSIFSNNEPAFKFPAELDNQYIFGKLLTDNLQPVNEYEVLIMSVPGKEALFQYTTTDMKGDFNFKVDIGNESKDFIIQPDLNIINQKVYIESSFANQYISAKVFIDSLKENIPPVILRQILNYRIRKSYASSSAREPITPNIRPGNQKRFYGTPDFELNMKDFVTLDSMPEVFFELIPRVSLELKNSVYEISVTDPLRNKLEGSPVVMLDGVIIKDLSTIVNLNPDLVEKIDVVWDRYRVGGYIFNGIINIISKSSDFRSGLLPDDAIRVSNRLFEPVSYFVSPDYSTAEMKNSRIADYRNTLFWNPLVKPNENGIAHIKFWTSDIKAEYLVNVNGITSEGKTISIRTNFKVK